MKTIIVVGAGKIGMAIKEVLEHPFEPEPIVIRERPNIEIPELQDYSPPTPSARKKQKKTYRNPSKY